MGEHGHIAVVGAGVVGLSTAICIQEKIPNASVTIIADKFGSDTLSDGAGGLFRPSLTIDFDRGKVRKWCTSSLNYFTKLCLSTKSGEAGVQLVSGYHLSSSTKSVCQNALLEELLPSYRQLTSKELDYFDDSFKYGVIYSTIIVDCRYYLPWLFHKFKQNGGKVEDRHISQLSEIDDDFDVIVNCTGLGAKELMKDDQLISVRGQTIKVKAPWIKHFYFGDEAYVCPGVDYVTLGGIKDFDSWSTEVNPHQKKYIWEKCLKLVPSLEKAEFLWDWVGLRPYRPSVCIDSAIVHCNGKMLKVVNNYGHGGHGVTLSWGTANDAADCVKRFLTTEMLISKL